MIESGQPNIEHGHGNSKPLDGLSALRDPAFVEVWLYAQKKMDRLPVDRTSEMFDIIEETEQALNQRYDSDKLYYEPVVISGGVYPVLKNTSPLVSEKIRVDGEKFRFRGISFAPIIREAGAPYQAAFRLLPFEESPDVSHYYLPLVDAQEITFPEQLVPSLDPDQMHAKLHDILRRSRNFRKSENFISKTHLEKLQAIEDKAKEYSEEVAPLIDQRTPLLINTDLYPLHKTSGIVNTHDSRAQLNKDPRTRHIIAGRLVEIAFTFKSVSALNVNIAPFMLVENKTGDVTCRYEVSLDSDFSIQTLT
ncbi:MAG TPA: hypothetical protein VMT96_01175 [Candidatus Bathyarchaeia archaeon]|nr:hypothetical protein [Candidatus Bathyarchaeia archaeon]